MSSLFFQNSSLESHRFPKIFLPYYHIVTDELAPHVQHIYSFRSKREFEAHIDFFLASFNPISLSSFIQVLNGKEALPPRPLLLSFDDGFREMHDIAAPILFSKGCPAVFFLTTDFLDNKVLSHDQKRSLIIHHLSHPSHHSSERVVSLILNEYGVSPGKIPYRLSTISYSKRGIFDVLGNALEIDFSSFLKDSHPYLSSNQVQSLLNNGFEIGSHSLDHPLFSRLSQLEALRQATASTDCLQRSFSRMHRAFAFPHTDAGVSTETLSLMHQEAKLQVSFGTSGMLDDLYPRNFQRFSMEKSRYSPEFVFVKHLLRRWYRSAVGRQYVDRS